MGTVGVASNYCKRHSDGKIEHTRLMHYLQNAKVIGNEQTKSNLTVKYPEHTINTT